MKRHRSATLLALAVPFSIGGFVAAPARAQQPSPTRSILSIGPAPQETPVQRLDYEVAAALQANPATALYRIGVELRAGKIILSGRVGSKTVHDSAIQTVIPLTPRIVDELVIDTTEAYRVTTAAQASGVSPRPGAILSSYTYPPPLFGRYDEPFFGLEPPLIQHPAWWGAMSRYRLGPPAQMAANQGQGQAPAQPVAQAEPNGLPANTVEMTIDPLGVAVLRGNVATEDDRMKVGQQLAQSPGITKVINNLVVAPVANPQTGTGRDDVPPPPPTPSNVKPPVPSSEPTGRPIETSPPAPAAPPSPVMPRAERPEGVAGRIDRAIQSKTELAGQGVKVSYRDGVATISGGVPTVYEAMLAFRSVQQTPGVKEVVDSIRFVVPDGSSPNPLIAKGKPEDVEPYLEAQIRRQVGDSTHLDRVRIQGDELQVSGTLERADDRPRVEAILRSMPVLRGYKVVADFRGL